MKGKRYEGAGGINLFMGSWHALGRHLRAFAFYLRSFARLAANATTLIISPSFRRS